MKISILMTLILSSFWVSAMGTTLNNLSMPGNMMVLADHLVITDARTNTIHVFNLAGKELAAFGKQGQGPGEFPYIDNLQLHATDIFVSSGEKALFFTYDGKLLSEQRLSTAINQLLKTDHGWFGSEMTQKGPDMFSSVYRYTPDFSDKQSLAQRALPSPFASTIEMVEHCIRIEATTDRLFAANTAEGFIFTLYTQNGEKIKKVENKTYQKVKIGEDWKSKKIADLKSSPQIAENWNLIKNKLHFPEHFPAINDFSVSESGSILARTYQIQNGRNLFYLLACGSSKWRKIELPDKIAFFEGSSNRHFCNNDKAVFFLVENEDGNFDLFSQTL